MNRSGPNQFFWDTKPDILITNDNDILLKLDPPYPVSARFLGLPKKVVEQINKLLRPLVLWFDIKKFLKISLKLFTLPVPVLIFNFLALTRTQTTKLLLTQRAQLNKTR